MSLLKLDQRRSVWESVAANLASLLAPIRNNGGIILALLALYLIWGSTYLGIRFALESFPPFLMAAVRFLIAGSGLFIFLRARGESAPTRRQWIGAGIVGALLLGGGNGGVTFAEQWVSSGLAAVWIASMPLWAAFFGGLLGRWPSRWEWVGMALGFVGVGLLNFESNLRANPIGAVSLTIATITWALGSIWSQRLSLPKGMMASAAQMLVGSVVLFALSLITGERLTGTPTIRSVGAIAYLVAFGSLIGFSSYAYLLRRVRPALATSYAYVNPIVAVGLGVALAGEHISGVGLLAMMVVLCGVGLVVLKRR